MTTRKKPEPEVEVRAIDRADHRQVAEITISGETIVIGVYSHVQGDSLYLCTEEMIEPVYFTEWEATLLNAVLTAARTKLVGND